MKKSFFRRGFTLIELMIVIVILGVLMGTILPRITGMQARAKDTAVVADINTISQALEAYYSDGSNTTGYPADAGDETCIGGATDIGVGGDDVGGTVAGYIKGGKAPTPKVTMTQILALTCTNLEAGYAYGRFADGYIVAGKTDKNNNFTFTLPTTVVAAGDKDYKAVGVYGASNIDTDADYARQFYIATN